MNAEPAALAATVTEALRLVAEAFPRASTHYPGGRQVLTAARLDTLATGYAGYLHRRGIGPGDLVGLVHGTGPDFLACLFGTLRAGAAASVLPVPARLADQSRVSEQIGRIVAAAGMRHVIVDAGQQDFGTGLSAGLPGLAVLRPEMEPAAGRLPEPEPDDLAVVQFTSGTTGRPRGVMLTHQAVLAGLRAILVSARFTRDDVLVQWVPTYHDMGLFGLLSQVLNGATAHVFDPMAFIRDPAGLIRYASEHGCTITTGPNFGYDMLTEAVRSRGDHGLALGRMRLAINGSEPVKAASLERLARVLGPIGLRPEAVFPVYGMAEATLAVTFPTPGRRPRVVHVDRDRLAGGVIRLVPACSAADAGAEPGAEPGAAPDRHAKPLVAVGRPVHGIEMRLVDEAGLPVADAALGEIQIRGEAVTSGYYRDPAATEALFDGTWLRTGDLGFVLDGDLFITGRRSEMVIVHGRNHHPEDAEAVAAGTPGIYRGRCVAFRVDNEDSPDGEAFGLAVETALPQSGHADLAAAVRRRVAAALGIAEVVVYPVPPGWLTRTTSGKPQRLLARHRLRAAAGVAR